MTGHICEYCNRTYKSISNLHNHQKTANFCLKLQNKINIHTCSDCNKSFTTKTTLLNHQHVCKEKKQREEKDVRVELDELKLENTLLKSEIAKLKGMLSITQIPTTNNIINNTNNTIVLSFDQLFSNLKSLNPENVAESIKLLSSPERLKEIDFENFDSQTYGLLTNIFNQFAFCTDKKRRTVVTKSDDDKAVRTNLSYVLSDFIDYGQEEIVNYLDNAKNELDEGVNNDIIDEMTHYAFEPKYKALEQLVKADNMNVANENNTFHQKMATTILHDGLSIEKNKMLN